MSEYLGFYERSEVKSFSTIDANQRRVYLLYLLYHIPYTIGYMVQQSIHKQGEPNVKARKVINMAIGSIAKIPQMVDENRYCPEIIQQIDSVIGLLHSARKELLRGHLESCLAERLKTDKEGSIKELLKIYNMQ